MRKFKEMEMSKKTKKSYKVFELINAGKVARIDHWEWRCADCGNVIRTNEKLDRIIHWFTCQAIKTFRNEAAM